MEVATVLYARMLKTVRGTEDDGRLFDLIQQLNPILAEKKGDILTKRALDAPLRSARTVMQLQGKSPQQIDDAIPKLRDDIIVSFLQSPDAVREVLQASESRWFRLLTGMNSSNQEERLAKFAKAKESAGSDQLTLNLAHALEEGAVQEIWTRDMDKRL